MNTTTLEQLVAARVAAKAAEDAAIARRREIDAALIEAIPDDDGRLEGTTTVGVGQYKVSVTRKLTRKVDTGALQAAWGNLSLDVQAAFKWSADLSVAEYRKLDQAAALVVSKFVEAKPAAAQIKVEV